MEPPNPSKKEVTKMKEQTKIYDLAEYPVTIIENAILESNLSAHEKLILIALKRFAGRADRAWPGRETIAKLASCSTATVKRVLKKLEEKDLLRVTRREGKTSIYLLPGYRISEGHLIAVWPEIEEFGQQIKCQSGSRKSGKSGDFEKSGKPKQKVSNFPETGDPEIDPGQGDPGGGSERPGSHRPGSQRPPKNIYITSTYKPTYTEKPYLKNNNITTIKSKEHAKVDVVFKEEVLKEEKEVGLGKTIKEEWERAFCTRFPFEHLDDKVVRAADYMLYLKWTGKTLRLKTPVGYLKKLTTLNLEPFPSYDERKKMTEEAQRWYDMMLRTAAEKYERHMKQEMARSKGPRFC